MKSRATTPAHLGNAMNADGKTEMLADEPNPPPEEKSWGFHLIIDMSNCNDRIDDVKEIERFFADLTAELKMEVLIPFAAVKVKGRKGRGVTALQGISQSSITFHSDDEKRSVYLDVFSCEKLDVHGVLDFIQAEFEPSRMAHEMIYRDAGLSAGSKH